MRASSPALLLALGGVLAFCPGAAAEAPPLPRHRLTYEAVLSGRYNAAGLSLQPELRYRFRLHGSGAPLKRDAHLGLAFAPSVTPYLARIGPAVVVKPFAVLSLRIGYYHNRWYGTFGHLRTVTDATADAYAADTDLGGDTGVASSGHELYAQLTLVGAVGPFLLSNRTTAAVTRQRLPDGAALYYSPVYDIVLANDGWVMASDTDLVFVTESGLVVGARAAVTHAFYRAAHFRDGEKTATSATPTVALGPLAAYTFFDRPLSAVNRPTLFAAAGWWLRHPYRAGQGVHRGLPLIVIGFSVEGDIWSAP